MHEVASCLELYRLSVLLPVDRPLEACAGTRRRRNRGEDKSTVRPRHRPCATNVCCVYEGDSLKLKRCYSSCERPSYLWPPPLRLRFGFCPSQSASLLLRGLCPSEPVDSLTTPRCQFVAVVPLVKIGDECMLTFVCLSGSLTASMQSGRPPPCNRIHAERSPAFLFAVVQSHAIQ